MSGAESSKSAEPARIRPQAKIIRRSTVVPVPSGAFAARQLCLFQNFLASTRRPGDELSNAFDDWDCIPRYPISRARMNTLRTSEGFLEVLEIPFKLRQRNVTALIYPARIRGGEGRLVSYYPSAREELIEHALRKLATEHQAGFFDWEEYRSGVRFSLYRLRRELEQQGHSMRYDELIEGLDILSLSSIELVEKSNGNEGGFARSTYLTALAGVRRNDYDVDHEARWVAQFHPMVTRGIDTVTYRQFNYRRLMMCQTQLARWLLSQLIVKYTQASTIDGFEMRFSTIRRDSALLDGYGRIRDAVAALDGAWSELKALSALDSIKKMDQRGSRNKIQDVTYAIKATRDFQEEQKAANRRRRNAMPEVAEPFLAAGKGWHSAVSLASTAVSSLLKSGV
jgi:hypothetical protein